MTIDQLGTRADEALDSADESRRPRPKILFVSPAPAGRGGVAQFAGNLAHALDTDADVEVVGFRRLYPKWTAAGRRTADADGDGMSTPVWAVLVAWLPWTWVAAARHIRRTRPALLVVQWWHPLFAICFWYLTAVARRHGSQVVFVCHNSQPHEPFPFSRALTRLTLARAHRVLVLSRSVAAALAGIVPERVIQVLAHPPNLHQGSPDASQEWKLRIDAGDRPIVLFFGCVRQYKGVDDLIGAMPAVLSDVQATLVVAGQFFLPLARFEYLAASSGVADSVRFLPGYIPDEQVDGLLRAADVVVLPYRSGSQSGVIAQAALAETPVVATAVAGVREALDGCGIVVPPSDPAALAGAIVRALGDPPPPPRLYDPEWHDWRRALLALADPSLGVRPRPADERGDSGDVEAPNGLRRVRAPRPAGAPVTPAAALDRLTAWLLRRPLLTAAVVAAGAAGWTSVLLGDGVAVVCVGVGAFVMALDTLALAIMVRATGGPAAVDVDRSPLAGPDGVIDRSSATTLAPPAPVPVLVPAPLERSFAGKPVVYRLAPSPAPRRRQRHRPDPALAGSPRWRVAVLVSAIAVSVVSAVAAHVTGRVGLYGDEASHLLTARRVFDSLTPGFGQLGNYWPPILHFLELPFVWIGPLYRTMWAGTIPAMACYVVGVLGAYELGVQVTNDRRTGAITALAYGASPSLVYLQTAAMLESAVAMSLVWSGASLVRFTKTGAFKDVVVAGAWTAVCIWSSWSGFVVPIYGALVIVVACRRKGFSWAKTNTFVLAYSMLAVYTLVLWTGWNFYIQRDPLYVLHYHQPVAQLVGDMRFVRGNKGDVPFAVFNFVVAAFDLLGPFLLFAMLTVVVVAVLRRRLLHAGAVTMAGGILVVANHVFNGSALGSPTYARLMGFSSFESRTLNIRYVLWIVPFAAFCVAVLAGSRRWRQMTVLSTLVLSSVWFVPSVHGVNTLDPPAQSPTAVEFEASLGARLRTEGSRGIVLMSSINGGDRFIWRSGLPTSRFLTESNGQLFSKALKNPSRYAKYVFLAPGSTVTARTSPSYLADHGYQLVWTKARYGADQYFLWEREAP